MVDVRALPVGLLLCACGESVQAQHRWHCGEAFAIDLEAAENVETTSPVEDFVLHRLTTPSGLVVIYEGNAPQPADEVIETGMDWPNVIAIHDNRSFKGNERNFRRRLVTGSARASVCPSAPSAGRNQ